MTNNEILKIDKDGTTRLSQRSVKAKAEQLPKPEPEFLDFDPSEMPCITVSKTKVIDNKFLFTAGGDDANMFSYEDFVNHDTIVIKSCTGTGKTTATANHYQRLTETTKGLRFLSIVDKISLSEEHVKALKQINMVSYRETESISKTSASVICVNSLQKLIRITDKEISSLVVYIDEIDSFLKFTHNQTIDNMKPIYQTLKRIVNKCAKLIVSDATILNNLFIFLRNRVSPNSLLLTNSFRKYQRVKAYHHSDEQEFLDCLLANVEKIKGSFTAATVGKLWRDILSYAKMPLQSGCVRISF
jgi:Cdc6-like AAA superfamily ATPase